MHNLHIILILFVKVQVVRICLNFKENSSDYFLYSHDLYAWHTSDNGPIGTCRIKIVTLFPLGSVQTPLSTEPNSPWPNSAPSSSDSLVIKVCWDGIGFPTKFPVEYVKPSWNFQMEGYRHSLDQCYRKPISPYKTLPHPYHPWRIIRSHYSIREKQLTPGPYQNNLHTKKHS